MDGRLSQSPLSLSHKHPPILSSKDVLTHLLVCSLHCSLCHCGPSLLLCSTGSRAHSLGARRLVRDVCRRCVICRRVTALAEQQQMGQLPSARVTPSPTFSKTGMDYAGPFLLKRGHVRKPTLVKTYICIFVCFSTKATHIEVVRSIH